MQTRKSSPNMLTVTLDNEWEVKSLWISAKGFIDTLRLRNLRSQKTFDARFDRGKLIFIDEAPPLSDGARMQLARQLNEIADAA